ncbi:hypothetical protein BpHYR1_010816 [Brachionus plicatilis]|uniref:Uncharacterized protein n=1 Tax=Brachionus plicatilis TaxID=10195 RepID=A0A3M7QHJ1_BRAPC|nr:hypothetical protein BpHYR1_010816 [Brachionus plicatilis]
MITGPELICSSLLQTFLRHLLDIQKKRHRSTKPVCLALDGIELKYEDSKLTAALKTKFFGSFRRNLDLLVEQFLFPDLSRESIWVFWIVEWEHYPGTDKKINKIFNLKKIIETWHFFNVISTLDTFINSNTTKLNHLMYREVLTNIIENLKFFSRLIAVIWLKKIQISVCTILYLKNHNYKTVIIVNIKFYK